MLCPLLGGRLMGSQATNAEIMAFALPAWWRGAPPPRRHRRHRAASEIVRLRIKSGHVGTTNTGFYIF